MLRETCLTTPIGAAILAAALLAVAPQYAKADPVPVVGPPFGTCPTNGSGCLNGGGLSVQVTADTCINFFNGNNPDVCGATGNTFTVGGPLDMSNFTLNATGTIKDLQFNSPPPTEFLTVPGPLGTVKFDLVSVVP